MLKKILTYILISFFITSSVYNAYFSIISFIASNLAIRESFSFINDVTQKGTHSGGANYWAKAREHKFELLKQQYPNIRVKKFDISEHSGIEEFIDNVVLELGGLDILVNNAGINMDNLSIRMKDEEWTKVINVNLSSTFLLSKHSIRKMLKSKFGRIVNITSVVGHTGNLGQSNYAASKAGIIGMSKSLAAEYAKKNITVNCVSPGFIVSDMTMNIAEKVKLYLTSKIPMGKLGTGEDVSNCVAFLSSDQASYITGETIHVNGGMYMA